MFDKKARTVSDHMILWIPKFIYLVIAFLSVVFLLRLLIVINIDSAEANARILNNRLLYSPNAISYLDLDINRGYPGIIDIGKYRNLENIPINEIDSKIITYGGENKLMASKLVLKDIETSKEETIFYNKENYEFWEPRILSTVEGGSGSVKSFEEQRYVVIKDNDNLKKGILRINTIVRT